jgi:hypothetical protein
MRTANVSRAAERVGISQPAMSGALSRLRQLFGDPPLIRTGQKMVPTERAMELHRLFAAGTLPVEVLPLPFDVAHQHRAVLARAASCGCRASMAAGSDRRGVRAD